MKKVLIALMLVAWGCDDGGPITPVDGFEPAPAPAGFAVVNSEFGGSTAISLLDKDAEVIATNWLTSGTVAPGLVAALSTDIVMPSVPSPDAMLVIDRTNGVLTRIDVDAAEVLGQLVVGQNPGDVAYVGEMAWVTRREIDPTDAAVGGDLVEFDPATMVLTGRRVDLSGASDAMTDAQPKPLRVLNVDGTLVVGLDRLTADDFSDGADGWLGTVDASDATLTANYTPLAPLKNCGGVSAVPGETAVVVVCNGVPFGDRATSGIALVTINTSPGGAVVQRTWVVGDEPSHPAATNLVTSLGGSLVLAAATDEMFTAYTYYTIDLQGGVITEVFSGEPQFGKVTYDASDNLLLVPGGTAGVRSFDWTGTEFTELEAISFGAGALPTYGIWPLN